MTASLPTLQPALKEKYLAATRARAQRKTVSQPNRQRETPRRRKMLSALGMAGYR